MQRAEIAAHDRLEIADLRAEPGEVASGKGRERDLQDAPVKLLGLAFGEIGKLVEGGGFARSGKTLRAWIENQEHAPG